MIHARLRGSEEPSLVDLLNPPMGMIVLPTSARPRPHESSPGPTRCSRTDLDGAAARERG
jgi:hypothetical protein